MMARHRIRPSLRELMNEMKGSSPPGMYVSNTLAAINPPCNVKTGHVTKITFMITAGSSNRSEG